MLANGQLNNCAAPLVVLLVRASLRTRAVVERSTGCGLVRCRRLWIWPPQRKIGDAHGLSASPATMPRRSSPPEAGGEGRRWPASWIERGAGGWRRRCFSIRFLTFSILFLSIRHVFHLVGCESRWGVGC